MSNSDDFFNALSEEQKYGVWSEYYTVWWPFGLEYVAYCERMEGPVR